MPRAASPLARIRRLCLGLPEATERISHGTPMFFVRDKRSFAQYWADHHGDGRLVLWCAAAPGRQALLVKKDPGRYFVPPYVAHLGWVGMYLDRGLDWDEVAARIEEAYLAVAPKSLAALVVRPKGRGLAR